MASESRYLYGPVEMSFLANQTLDIFIDTLVCNGILEKEKAEELENYRAVITQPGFFGKLFSTNKRKENGYFIDIVKILKNNETQK